MVDLNVDTSSGGGCGAADPVAHQQQQQQQPQVVLFGPQITLWTRDSLRNLQSRLIHDSDLGFLQTAIAGVSALRPVLRKIGGASVRDFIRDLEDLERFAKGIDLPELHKLSNTLIAPLTIIAHIAELCDKSNESHALDRYHRLSQFHAAQGFCTGFLSAAALASSRDREQFECNVSNAIRLAVCLGFVVDDENSSRRFDNQAVAVSARWKTAAGRTLLDACVDLFPNAYVSCITDEGSLTITVQRQDQEALCARLNEFDVITSPVGLDGSYHHTRHAAAAEKLKRLCDGDDQHQLQLPGAEHLRLPLRSTADGRLLSRGSLHDIAIDLILCKRAHWFTAVTCTRMDFSGRGFHYIAIGSGSPLPRSLALNMSGTRQELRTGHEEIAVVGMACRFPGAQSVQEFWEMLSSGASSVGKLPADRFDRKSVGREPKPKEFWGNFIRRPDAFDHRFFNISGREAKSMDPQQRLILQVAYEALEASGYCSLPSNVRETDVGCYLGVGSVDYNDNVGSENANAFAATGTLRAFISGRVSHFFGWLGPSLTFDTACSSSAVAIHTACKALLAGECSMALAGGVNIITSPDLHQNLAAASFLNDDGASRAFDANAAGYCRGEGAGLIFLKPLSKAEADGDRILGVIAGTAVNQGSNCSPITVPDSRQQSALYKRALSSGRLKASDVTYVEAHGTGTQVGDPIEYESIRLALANPDRKDDVFLGSAKDNIGHCEAASGAAGVIKTLLMMQHASIPKQANFNTLNPKIKTSSSDKIKIATTSQPWDGKRKVALVNNYGAAGSNAAIAIREHADRYTRMMMTKYPGLSYGDSQLDSKPAATYPFVVSAKSANSLSAYIEVLKSYVTTHDATLAEVSYSLSRMQNPAFEYRASFVAGDESALTHGMDILLSERQSMTKVIANPPVVLCFGGQTGRIAHVHKELERSTIFSTRLNQCDKTCKDIGLPSIFPGIFSEAPVDDLVELHCKLLSVQIASARSWMDSGLAVDTLIGHSFGQLTALHIAGCLSLEDTFRFVSGRARLIRDGWGDEDGVMLSVECDRSRLDAMVSAVESSYDIRVDVACYNGQRSFVLAGTRAAIDNIEEQCGEFKTVRLDNSHAYHSRLADVIMNDLESLAASVRISDPQLHIETCSGGGNWTHCTAAALAQHTRQPVYFHDAIERIAARLPSAVWLEAGSGSAIIPMARRLLRDSERSDTFIPVKMGGPNALASLADATVRLWQGGCAFHSWEFPPQQPKDRRRVLNLPPYQFEDVRHWIDYKPRSGMAGIQSSLEVESTWRRSHLLMPLKHDDSSGERLFLVNTSNITFELAGRGHAVTGQSLCPASMYIEIAARGALLTQSNSSLDSVIPKPSVHKMTMTAPLGFGGDFVLLRLRKAAAPDGWNFVISSSSTMSELKQHECREHAQGEIRFISPGDVMADARLQLLKKIARYAHADRILKMPSARGLSGPLVYELFSEVVEYASYFCGVRSIMALENEAVGSVIVPADQPICIDSVVCDPIALDNFLQVAGIHVNCLNQRSAGEVFVCTAIEEVIFTEAFMRDKTNSRAWTVYTRYEYSHGSGVTNDIVVYDTRSKDLVLAIMGATFRNVAFKSLSRSLARINSLPRSAPMTRSVSQSGSDPFDDDDPDPLTRVGPTTPPSETEDREFLKPGQSKPREKIHHVAKIGDSRSLRQMLGEVLEIPIGEIEATSSLEDLGIDSLLVTELLSEIEQRFGIKVTQEQFAECTDVRSLYNILQQDQIENDDKPPTANLPRLPSPKPEGGRVPVSIVLNDKDNGASHEHRYSANVNVAADCHKSFRIAKNSYEQHSASLSFAGFCSGPFRLQSELVVQYVLEAFAALGCDVQSLVAGAEIPMISHHSRHDKVVPQLYLMLADAGLVRRDSDGKYRRTAVPAPDKPSGTLHSALLSRYPQHASETKLLHTTAHKLADCLSGRVDPVSLIFKDSKTKSLLEDVYTNAPMFKTPTYVLTEYLTSIFKSVHSGHEISILELGGGTGGTTKQLMESLAGLDRKFIYTFTDLSPSLVAGAKRKFAKYSQMQYAVLDIEKEPASELQGRYDIIISTNCIHATRSLVTSATNIRKMLQPTGVLCLIELTRNLYWFDLVFGLLEGWWLFSDGREHALASEQLWKKDLLAAGFQWIDWTDSTSAESDICRVVTASPFHVDTQSFSSSPTVTPRGSTSESSPKLELQETVVFRKKTDGLELKADIYYPSEMVETGKLFPVALMIHGGGHVMLSRKDVRPEQTQLLLSHGFLPISVDYRLCPETTLAEGPMNDVADALEWVRNELPTLQLTRRDLKADGSRVVAVGWSTGGTLAMSLGWTIAPRGFKPPDAVLAFYCPTDYEDVFWTKPNMPRGSPKAGNEEEEEEGRRSVVGFDDQIWAGISDSPITGYNVPRSKHALGGWLSPSDARSRIALYMNHQGRALQVLLRGLNKRTRTPPDESRPPLDEIRAVSPLAQISSGAYAVPTFIVHPRRDDLIPWQQAQRTADAMQARGVVSELRLLDRGLHLFDVCRGWQSDEAAAGAVRDGYKFLARHVGLE